MHALLNDIDIKGFEHFVEHEYGEISVKYQTFFEGERFGFKIVFSEEDLDNATEVTHIMISTKMERARFYGMQMLERLNAS